MDYTVKELARLAGVTPRTLRYYDQIGLLKPSRIGENGYRGYGEEALLRLQQILLYRELDMPLDEIKLIVWRPEFDVLEALEGHREHLLQRIAQMQHLIATVDYTINCLKGKNEMNSQHLFKGFSDEQQAEYEKEAMQMYDPATVKASNEKWRQYSSVEKQRILDEGNAIYQDILKAMPGGAASPETQACIERWRRHLEYFWTPNVDALLGLADLYNDDPRYKANFDKMDPRLAEFLRAAVQAYVENRKK